MPPSVPGRGTRSWAAHASLMTTLIAIMPTWAIVGWRDTHGSCEPWRLAPGRTDGATHSGEKRNTGGARAMPVVCCEAHDEDLRRPTPPRGESIPSGG